LETMAKALADLKAQIAAEQQVLARIEAEQGDKVKTLTTQIDALKAHRGEAARHVPAEALRPYARVSIKYPGAAMAPPEFDENDLDSVSCGSCFMGLNVELLNALRGRDEIRRCNSCNRILYLPEMLAQA